MYTHLSVYIYVMYIYVCVCLYILIYIYTYKMKPFTTTWVDPKHIILSKKSDQERQVLYYVGV